MPSHYSEHDLARAILAARPFVPDRFVDDVMAALPGTRRRSRGGLALALGGAVAAVAAVALLTLRVPHDRTKTHQPTAPATQPSTATKSIEVLTAELVTEIDHMLDEPVPDAGVLIEKLERLDQLRARLPRPREPVTRVEKQRAIEEAERQIKWDVRVQKALLRAK